MKPLDLLIALAVVSIWGVNFVVIRIGLQDLPPILFTALRFVFAAVPLVFFLPRPRLDWRLLLGFAMFQFALQFSLLFFGMKLGLPAGLASLVIQLQAFFTIGMAVLWLGERPLPSQLAGALIALAGMALVAAHLEARATLIGFVLVVTAGLCWAVANVFSKKMGPVNPLNLVAWASLLASPPLLAVSFLVEGPAAWQSALSHLSWTSVAAVLFQSYPNTLFGFAVWSMLMRRYPAATVAPFSLLVPVAGMLSAAWLLDEGLQWWKMVAGLLVLAGLMLNQFGSRLQAWLQTARR